MEKHNKRKLLWLGIFACLIILALLAVNQQKNDYLFLTFCDVGQGDAVLASYKNKQVLIDGGPPSGSKQLLVCLQQQMGFWDRKIEVVVNTHPDQDHFGGLTEVVSRYRIGWFLHSGFDNSDNWRWQELKKDLIDKKVCTKVIPAGEVFRVDKLYFESLFPRLRQSQAEAVLQTDFFDDDKKCPQPKFDLKTDNLNNNSVVLKLRFGEFDALLTGDLERENERLLVWRNKLTPVEVLKAGHHGAKNSTSLDLLKATKPELVVISVGENSFGHPTKAVLERLRAMEIDIKRTDNDGVVKIVSDGVKWWLNE
jgi:competence protein ComEC